MRRLIHTIAFWIHLYIGPLEDRGVVPKLYRWTLKREAATGRAPFILNGNSVVAAGLLVFRQIPGMRIIAIPGMKLTGIRANMFAFAAPNEPDIYIFDGLGNDFRDNVDPDEAFEELKVAVSEARIALGASCQIYWINIVPPGRQWPELAGKIVLFNERVRMAGWFVKILDIHSRLRGEDGLFCKPEYSEPKDGIHNTPIAYEREWGPMINGVINKHNQEKGA